MNLRSPYVIFVSFSVILLISAIELEQQGYSFGSQVLINLGTSVMVVVIVEWLWKNLGGDPLIQAITEFKRLNILVREAEAFGIKRIYIRRGDIDFNQLLFDIKNAHKIDLMGVNLLANWFGNPAFLPSWGQAKRIEQ